MVPYTRTFLAVALLSLTVTVLATPIEVFRRNEVDDKWTTTPFVNCMKGKNPNFPSGSISQVDAQDCFKSTKGHSKRTVIDMAPQSENITRDLKGRGLFPDLKAGMNTLCDQVQLPKNFVVVTDLRVSSRDWCTQMR